jgi:hypothetical protein
MAHSTGYPTGVTGLDQTFYDCNTSINQQVALEACAQYSGSASNCTTDVMYGTSCPNGDRVVCNFYAVGQACVCWVFQGPAVGWAANSGSTTACVCAAGSTALGDVQYH